MLSGKIISTAESLRSIDYTRGLVICKLNCLTNVCLFRKNSIFKSIRLRTGAHVAEKNVATSQNDTKATKAKRDDEIELRVQGASRNKPFVVHIGKSETISSLYFQCAEEFKCKPDKVRLEWVQIHTTKWQRTSGCYSFFFSPTDSTPKLWIRKKRPKTMTLKVAKWLICSLSHKYHFHRVSAGI